MTGAFTAEYFFVISAADTVKVAVVSTLRSWSLACHLFALHVVGLIIVEAVPGGGSNLATSHCTGGVLGASYMKFWFSINKNAHV